MASCRTFSQQLCPSCWLVSWAEASSRCWARHSDAHVYQSLTFLPAPCPWALTLNGTSPLLKPPDSRAGHTPPWRLWDHPSPPEVGGCQASGFRKGAYSTPRRKTILHFVAGQQAFLWKSNQGALSPGPFPDPKPGRHCQGHPAPGLKA